MSAPRVIRMSKQMKREIAGIIHDEVKDPRIPSITSVTKVTVTKDMRYAKVYISIMGDDDSIKKALQGLEQAKPFIRRSLSSKISTRFIPELIFEIDKSIEYGVYIESLIKKVNEKQEDIGTDDQL